MAFLPAATNIGMVLWAMFSASFVYAEVPQQARAAQIIVLGEQHDNAAHHLRQSEWVAALGPKALVFEMLTPRQAARATSPWSDQTSLDALIGWSQTSWPAFDMYYPIFAAAPEAVIYGAGVSRDDLRKTLKRPLAKHPQAARYGLGGVVDPVEQAAREALQAIAHCGALPSEMLPVMVDAQRLRDMELADVSLRALRATGGPVVVIAGNGHARSDWGMPALVAAAAPDVSIFALGQGEDGLDVHGRFAVTLDAPAPERGDPCAAFNQ